MNIDGTDKIDLNTGPGPDIPEAWSPDGQKILYYASASNGFKVMNADGSGQTSVNLGGSEPDWQPLGGLDPYPRPGSATPLRVPLVPEYKPCNAPNSLHAAPLADPSCTSPALRSPLLTTSSIGKGSAFARYRTIAGDPSTTADEADLEISAVATDVRNASDQTDYAGEVMLTAFLRITDSASGFGGVSATVQDMRFAAPTVCVPTDDPGTGSTCSIATTADTLVPGAIVEGKRALIGAQNIRLRDAGPDGDLDSPPGCPPVCGTGDEQPFLVQGLFAP